MEHEDWVLRFGVSWCRPLSIIRRLAPRGERVKGGNSGLSALTGSFAPGGSSLAQAIRLGVAFHKTVMAMRQLLSFSFLILPLHVPWAPALPQTVNSTQQAALKSKSQSPKWTEVDERALLAKAQQGD